MDISGFNRLDKDIQLELLMMLGVLLVQCERSEMVQRLFYLHTFYVELYSLKHSGEIVWVHAFEDTQELEPFLEEIDISELAL